MLRGSCVSFDRESVATLHTGSSARSSSNEVVPLTSSGECYQNASMLEVDMIPLRIDVRRSFENNCHVDYLIRIILQAVEDCSQKPCRMALSRRIFP